MATPLLDERVLTAPAQLGLENRAGFRSGALALLSEMPEGGGRLIIDFQATRAVDSAGLSALILVRRFAADRRQVVRLRGLNQELRFLLVLTKLDDLFEIEEAGGA